MTPFDAPPDRITLLYRAVGPTHVFTTSEWTGFHIGSCDLRDAFNQAIEALGEFATELYGFQASYEAEMPFEEFEQNLRQTSATEASLLNNFVIAKRAENRITADSRIT